MLEHIGKFLLVILPSRSDNLQSSSPLFHFSVCAPGFYENGTSCLPCAKFISGSGGENLTDGDINTCAPGPFQNKMRFRHYQIGIHDNCIKPEVNVSVAVDNSTTCDDVRGAIFSEKPHSGCNDKRFGACTFTGENQFVRNKRICSLRCKCAESADQCLVHIFSGITPKEMSFCEIKADRF